METQESGRHGPGDGGLIGIRDFLEYSSVSGLAISPDGERIGFVLTKPDLESDGYVRGIWVYETATDSVRELQAGNSFTEYAWYDAGRILVAEKDRSGTGFYLLDVAEGGKREYGRVALSVDGLKPIDGLGIAMRGQPCPSGPETEGDYEIRDGTANDAVLSSLYVYDPTGVGLKSVSEGSVDVRSFAARDGKIVFVASGPDDAFDTQGIFVHDLDTGRTTQVLSSGEYSVVFADAMGDTIVFVGSLRRSSLPTDNPAFYRIDGRGISPWLDADLSVRDTVGFDCAYGSCTAFRVSGESLYLVSTNERGSFLLKVASDGIAEALTEDGGAVQDFDVCGDAIAYVGLRNLDLQELFLRRDGQEKRITCFNRQPLAGKRVAEIERFSFDSGGRRVNFLAHKPIGFSPEGKYPAILYIHGGPKAIYGAVFYHELQVMAGKGYFVIFGNPRGSDGQGSAFANLEGIGGKADFGDIMGAVDAALERYPQIDAGRMGVIGVSYGGTMTNWIIGHTDRFKCAVAQRSLCNLISAIGTAGNGYAGIHGETDAVPWRGAERLWEMSPLKYAKEIRTPLLLINTDRDRDYPVSEAEQLFSALRYLRRDVRFFRLRNESQSLSRLWRPLSRIKRLEVIMEWFEEHLKSDRGRC